MSSIYESLEVIDKEWIKSKLLEGDANALLESQMGWITLLSRRKANRAGFAAEAEDLVQLSCYYFLKNVLRLYDPARGQLSTFTFFQVMAAFARMAKDSRRSEFTSEKMHENGYEDQVDLEHGEHLSELTELINTVIRSERDKGIFLMHARSSTLSLESIGKIYGLSRERVRQISVASKKAIRRYVENNPGRCPHLRDYYIG